MLIHLSIQFENNYFMFTSKSVHHNSGLVALYAIVGSMLKNKSISEEDLITFVDQIKEKYNDKKKIENNLDDNFCFQTLVKFDFYEEGKKYHLILTENLFEEKKNPKFGKLFIQYDNNLLEISNIDRGNDIIIYTIEDKKEDTFRIIENKVIYTSSREESSSPETVIWDLENLEKKNMKNNENLDIGITPLQSDVCEMGTTASQSENFDSSRESSFIRNDSRKIKFKNERDGKWYSKIPPDIINLENNFSIKKCEICNRELNPQDDRYLKILSRLMFCGMDKEDDEEEIKNPIDIVKRFWKNDITKCQSCRHEVLKNNDETKKLYRRVQSDQDFSKRTL